MIPISPLAEKRGIDRPGGSCCPSLISGMWPYNKVGDLDFSGRRWFPCHCYVTVASQGRGRGRAHQSHTADRPVAHPEPQQEGMEPPEDLTYLQSLIQAEIQWELAQGETTPDASRTSASGNPSATPNSLHGDVPSPGAS